MFQSLRMRLTFSHILPVIIIAPIIMVILVYLLETQYFLSNFASGLIVQASIIQHFTQGDSNIWQSRSAARTMIYQLESSIPARLMLIDPQGRLLASSLATDQNRVGKTIQMTVVNQALHGQPAWVTDYNPFIGQRVVDVAVPVLNPSGRIIGVVRLSQDLGNIQEKLVPVSALILISLLIAFALAIFLGLLLAKSISAPLRYLAQAVIRLTPTSQPELVEAVGPIEVRTLAESFNQMFQRLYDAEQSQRRLLVSFVHELGTPLGAIKAAAQALQQGAISDEELGLELAEGISMEVDQLRRLLDDLTLLGETRNGAPVVNSRPVDIQETVETICRAFAYLVKQKNIQLDYDIDPQLPLILADPARLHQIISNLIHNAYKYTPPDGWIKVRVILDHNSETFDSVRLIVADNGPGIVESEQERIFQMFYRSPRQAEHQQGMGIGLAVARQLAVAHGGTLTVDSHLNQGASFVLCLPVGNRIAS